jgi:hypothetical protein
MDGYRDYLTRSRSTRAALRSKANEFYMSIVSQSRTKLPAKVRLKVQVEEPLQDVRSPVELGRRDNIRLSLLRVVPNYKEVEFPFVNRLKLRERASEARIDRREYDRRDLSLLDLHERQFEGHYPAIIHRDLSFEAMKTNRRPRRIRLKTSSPNSASQQKLANHTPSKQFTHRDQSYSPLRGLKHQQIAMPKRR